MIRLLLRQLIHEGFVEPPVFFCIWLEGGFIHHNVSHFNRVESGSHLVQLLLGVRFHSTIVYERPGQWYANEIPPDLYWAET